MAIDKYELTRRITEELKEEIGMPTIFIYPRKRKKLLFRPKLSITSSKFGGLPYWDKSMPYPTDHNGNKLMLLAQFNLGEISKICKSVEGMLPETGILQFFILSGDDYLYGSDIDDYTNSNHFRVAYHPTINPNVTKTDVLDLGIPTSLSSKNDYAPITGEIGLDFEIGKTVSPTSAEFKKRFIEKASEYGWKIDDTDDDIYNELYDCLDSNLGDELYACAYSEDSCLLGCPVFTQSDPRDDEEQYAKYDTQLFQMVSYEEEGSEFTSMWGDLGIAHFFINHNKLKAKDFSDVMYYWDCT